MQEVHSSLQNWTCLGSDFLWWVDLPENTTEEDVWNIQHAAEELQKVSDVLIVCGIGGSYLGARAIIEALQTPLNPSLSGGHYSEVVFLGNHLSGREYDRIFASLQNKRVSACIISKSGTTLETAISYRLVRNFLLSKYSEEEVKNRIITITDENNGALRVETMRQGYHSFILPADIGGRYSVLTPVGLLPCAFAGIDIVWLLQGAWDARKDIIESGQAETDSASRPQALLAVMTGMNHPAFQYAEKRVLLEQAGFVSELFITAEPSLYFIGEWWKQLMGESQGKKWKGLYPDTLSYTTDLHSLGQYVQEGRRLFFETMLWIEESASDMKIPAMTEMVDDLDTLVGRSLHELNYIALQSTAKAHNDGGCPSMMVTLLKLDARNIGYFLYTMMYSCALSGIMIGVNPFDQPGVEAYKKEMRKRF